MERVILVDGDDNIIGTIPRSELTTQRHRISTAFVINDRKELLIARRAHTKKFNPGKWSSSAAGTLTEGENYEENIKRELAEELGLCDVPIIKGPKICVENRLQKYVNQRFIIKWNGNVNDLTLQEGEVDDAKWISIDDLENDVRANSDMYTPNFINAIVWIQEWLATN